MKKKLLSLCSLIALAATAQADSNAFIQTATGTYDWNTAANWSLGTVPNSNATEAQFNMPGYLIATDAQIIVNVSSPVTLQKLYFPSSAATGASLTISGAAISLDNASSAAELQNKMSPTTNVALTIANDLVLLDPDGVGFTIEQKTNLTGNVTGAGVFIRSGHQDYVLFLGGNNTFSGGISIKAGIVEATTTTAFANTTGTLTFADMTTGGGIASAAAGTTTLPNAINLGATSNEIRLNSGGTGKTLDITTSSITDGGGTGAISIKLAAAESKFGVSASGIGAVKFSGTDFTVARNVTGAQYSSSAIELSPASGTQTWSGAFTGFMQQQSDSSANPSVIKSGAGTAILSGSNTYRSQTLVNAGTLLLNGTNIQPVNPWANDSGLGNAAKGRYEVASGGTLGGTGRINVALASAANANNMVLVKSGGLVAPGGVLPGGTFTLDAANFTRTDANDIVLNMATGAKFSFRLAGNGASADQLAFWNYANGDLLLSGGAIAVNLTLSSAGDGLAHTVTLFRFYSDGGSTAYSGANISSGLTLGTMDPSISGTPTFDYYADRIDLTYTAVPEPSTWVLLTLAGPFCMALRRRRK
jgi:fibronectin-binding autotransporter adhesin